MLVTKKMQTPIFLLAVLLPGCTHRVRDCHWNEDCGNGGSLSSGGTNQGGSNNGGSGAGGSTTTTRPPCDGKCVGTTPLCIINTNTCVECATNSDCSGTAGKAFCDTGTYTCVACLSSTDCTDASKPQCNTATKSCVACLSNVDCKDASASLCNTTTNTCGPCSADADCSQITGKTVCLTDVTGQANQCVQCTASNETACIVGTVANSCNPKTNVCTSTVKGSRKTCQSCLADSECGNGSGVVDSNKRCVPMTFNGATHGTGGYCLQRRDVAACTKPYAVLFSAVSLSGAAASDYCGINQTATTCEAVLDLFNSTSCKLDSDCGGGTGGLCKTSLSAGTLACTIPCGSTSECLNSGPGSTCSQSDGTGWCQ